MKQRSFVQQLDTLRRDLRRKRALGFKTMQKPTPWRVVARGYPGVPAGTLCAIAKGRIPHKPEILRALGLPLTVPVAVCLDCGQPPLSQRHRCEARDPAKPARPRRNWKGLALMLAGLIVNGKLVVR